mgnify:CR=1 FL=1
MLRIVKKASENKVSRKIKEKKTRLDELSARVACTIYGFAYDVTKTYVPRG